MKRLPTYDVGNPAPCFGQAQKWGGVKPINVIIILPTYNSIIILHTYNSIIILPIYNSISITGYNEKNSFFIFLTAVCSILDIVVCPFARFLLAIVLSVFLLSTVFLITPSVTSNVFYLYTLNFQGARYQNTNIM
jgi:hypothetical protein